MKVYKFGGSSVANAERIKNVCSIITSQNQPLCVISSAMKGVTDLLTGAADKAASGDKGYKDDFETIKSKHYTAIEELFSSDKSIILESVQCMLTELEEFLHGIELIQECSNRSRDLIMSFGERLSCSLISAYLIEKGYTSRFVDSRQLVKTDSLFNRAAVDFEKTFTNIAKDFKGFQGYSIVTGFIGSTEKDITTTLGRNGSDYSASIFGAALNSEAVEIWTDVDGVLSADPRIVDNSFVISELSIQEAMELAYFGAEVIHPYTLIPVMEKNIPVYIKNTYNVTAPGTVIRKNIERKSNRPFTGLASIDEVSIINIIGGGMMGIPGMASRIFSAIGKIGINIIMISQASSEHSICIVCRTSELTDKIDLLNEELSESLSQKQITKIDIKNGLEIVAVIGENMQGTPGISGKIFSSLGDAGINIFAIAQGSSEMNISFVINGSERKEALNTIHTTFLN